MATLVQNQINVFNLPSLKRNKNKSLLDTAWKKTIQPQMGAFSDGKLLNSLSEKFIQNGLSILKNTSNVNTLKIDVFNNVTKSPAFISTLQKTVKDTFSNLLLGNKNKITSQPAVKLTPLIDTDFKKDVVKISKTTSKVLTSVSSLPTSLSLQSSILEDIKTKNDSFIKRIEETVDTRFSDIEKGLIKGKIGTKKIAVVKLFQSLFKWLQQQQQLGYQSSTGDIFDNFPEREIRKKKKEKTKRARLAKSPKLPISRSRLPKISPISTSITPALSSPSAVPKSGGLLSSAKSFASSAAGSNIGKMLKTASPVLKKVAGPLAAGISAYQAYDAWQKGDMEGVGEAAGGGIGAIAGTAIGATIGSVVPVVGTAIGGFIGGILGDYAGSFIGKHAVRFFKDPENKKIVKTAAKAAFAGPIAIYKGAKFLGGAITKGLDKAWDGLKSVASSVWDSIKGIGSAIWDSTEGIRDFITEHLEDFGKLLFPAAGLLSSAWDGLTSIVTSGSSGNRSGRSNRSNSEFYAPGPNNAVERVAREGLGAISAQFESGGKGYSGIGYDKKGGQSFGRHQISSRAGTYDNFLKYLDQQGPEGQAYAAQLRATGDPKLRQDRTGSTADKWKELSAGGKDNLFNQLQDKFIQETHFDPAYAQLAQRNPELFNKVKDSSALQEMLFSTAVQHGPDAAVRILDKVYSSADSMEEYVNKVYEKRKTQFGSSDADTQISVANRYDNNEKPQILALLRNEAQQTPTTPELNTDSQVLAETTPLTPTTEEYQQPLSVITPTTEVRPNNVAAINKIQPVIPQLTSTLLPQPVASSSQPLPFLHKPPARDNALGGVLDLPLFLEDPSVQAFRIDPTRPIEG